MGRLFDELKRRNVIRVAVAYIVAAWVLLQAADLVLDNIEAPGWVMKGLMVGVLLLFPLVLGFSWAFEITPEGIRREKNVDRARSVTHETAKKLDRLTIALLVTVAALVAYDRLAPRVEPAIAVVSATPAIINKSIAVLAFQDLSPDGDQEFFADGIAEEILNVLAQYPDLQVAGRTSSFAFKNKDQDLREIGEILQVAHILEGSLRKSGDRVRVTAQLVKADSGFHLFSKNYDRKLTDIFSVQDDIAREIGEALRSTILGEKAVAASTPTNLEVYDRYLRARQLLHTRDRPLMENAATLLDEALAVDPDYAPALSQKALAMLLLSDAGGAYGGMPSSEALRASRPLLDQAVALDPSHADTHAIAGYWHLRAGPEHYDAATDSLQRALDINPTLANARNWLAILLGRRGAYRESTEHYERIVELDPLYLPGHGNLIQVYAATRSHDKAQALIRRVQRIAGETPSVLSARGYIALHAGQLADAFRDLHAANQGDPGNTVQADYFNFTAVLLGEYDTAADVGSHDARMLALTLAGRGDEAAGLAPMMRDRALSYGELSAVSSWYLLNADPGGLIEFLEHKYPDHGGLDSAMPYPEQRWGIYLHANLAYALRLAGRTAEAERALAVAEDYNDRQLQGGADNFRYWGAAAQLAALQGDLERLYARMQRALDTGFASVRGFEEPMFDPYRADPRFVALDAECKRRANAERRKLGLLAI